MQEEDPLAEACASDLLTALADPDYATRVRAACAIGDQLRFDRLELTPNLRAALTTLTNERTKEWHDLRFEAAIALCEAKAVEGGVLVEALSDSRRRFDALKALSRLPPTPPLLAKVQSVFDKWFLYWPDRLAAAATLAKWQVARGEAFFEKTLAADAQPYHRRALAVYLLGDLRMTNAYERLTKIARDPTDLARGAALRGLGHLFDQRAHDLLAQCVADETLAEDAAYALELLGTKS